MPKTILITGSTDGIGLETAKMLVSKGHKVLLHGRNPTKLEKAEKSLSALPGNGRADAIQQEAEQRFNPVGICACLLARRNPVR
ncbi:MAG: SDR family NAD(P)-dependent oxidoreductase [Leptolyngbyaceae cyanobacterium MO_188.B28]|nr:SDR family NAD(P)-dependent oxidoreductase [Leptolyngbyaceae cyanobacterium MO_188.B28]